jgi:hypothetical protein
MMQYQKIEKKITERKWGSTIERCSQKWLYKSHMKYIFLIIPVTFLATFRKPNIKIDKFLPPFFFPTSKFWRLKPSSNHLHFRTFGLLISPKGQISPVKCKA